MREMNVLQYAAICERMFEANLENVGTYKRKTTFYSDLSIAEWFGVDEIKDTFNRVMKSWLDDYEYMTEFIMSLNWKSFEHYHRGNDKLVDLYRDLQYKAQDKFYKHYKKNQKALDYFYEVTD